MLEFPALKNHWYVACRSSRLRCKPLKRLLLGEAIVLFRVTSGKASALRDLCPHRNAPLSSGRVAGDRIVCPYHGWQFDGDGRCRLVPGLDGEHTRRTRNAIRYHVKEQQGFVWVYGNPDEQPCREPYDIPYLGADGYRSFALEFPLAAELPDALENFLDTTHTHFVHRGLIRSETRRRKVVVLLRAYADRAEAEYIGDGQESGVIARLFGGGGDTSIDRFILPSIVQLEHRTQSDLKVLINLLVTPESDDSLRVHAVVSGPGGFLRYIQALTLGKLLIGELIRQDRAILGLQLLNKRAHEGARYTSTHLDLMRPYIMRLLKKEDTTDRPAPPERRVEVFI